MRFYVFISLLVIALILDLALFGMSLMHPEARLFDPSIARAAPIPEQRGDSPGPTLTSTPGPAAPTVTATATSTPRPSPTATSTPRPSPTATSTPLPPTATATLEPRLLAGKSVAFTPDDRSVRANIRLALGHYYGALTHVILAPGEVFSFNATLGLRPQRLPWKNVKLKPTAAPATAAPAPGAPDGPAPAEPEPQLVQGGGLCDLASRFVMAARPMLPARAFQFVNHVRSNGIHLSGVPARDSVSIWAIGGGQGEQDLKITNLTQGWLEFAVTRDGEKITVAARLWDRSPPGW